MKRKSSIPEEKLLPYETICAATRGDSDAMTKVLRHFDGYIRNKERSRPEAGERMCVTDGSPFLQ